jgi:Transposase
MKRKRYTDEQIAFALRQAEAGTAVEGICRKMGVSEPAFYRWKKQFAGMGVVEIRCVIWISSSGHTTRAEVPTKTRPSRRARWRGGRADGLTDPSIRGRRPAREYFGAGRRGRNEPGPARVGPRALTLAAGHPVAADQGHVLGRELPEGLPSRGDLRRRAPRPRPG